MIIMSNYELKKKRYNVCIRIPWKSIKRLLLNPRAKSQDDQYNESRTDG